MRPLSAVDLLDAWERGAGRTPVGQAQAILAVAFPEVAPDRLDRLTVARRDAILLLLRLQTFGTQIDGLAGCPDCGERLELAFDARDLPAGPLVDEDLDGDPTATLQVGGCEVTYRLPGAADLLAMNAPLDREAARRRLLEACILAARQDGVPVPTGELPGPILDAVEEGMAQAGADVVLAAACPACGRQLEIIFDIVSFFWAEIQARAMRLLQEVHALASAYGWSEADILRMSAWRRQRYLELTGND
jgi:uncharacterized protein (UPF0212 family)